MASDTVEQLINDVVGLTDVDPNLARIWVRDAARRTFEIRPWSFLLRRTSFTIPAAITNVSSGATCTISSTDPTLVTLSAAVVTTDMVGMQFRPSTAYPIYDITDYVSTTQFRIKPDWRYANLTASGFTINLSRIQMPQNILRVVSCVFPSQRWQLHTDVQQSAIDYYDPMRVRNNGNPSVLSPLDYTESGAGRIYAAVQVRGSGPIPISASTGLYTGQADSLFTVEVTTGGIGGTAAFKWKKDSGGYTTGVTSDTAYGNVLSDGVTVQWATASVYVLGDIFAIRASSNSQPGVARMELYPTISSLTVLPALILVRYPDVTDDNVALPGLLAGRGDVIREKALEFAAAYPGSLSTPNAYAQINRRDYHAVAWKENAEELSRQDNELFQQNAKQLRAVPFAPLPWGAGSLQEYDPAYIFPD